MELETILIVGGDDAMRELIAASIVGAQTQGAQNEIDRVLDSEAALRYLQVRPDCKLVIASLEPQTSGISLLDTLSQEYPGTPVVLFAQHKSPKEILEAFRHGVFDLLALPCDRGVLAATIGAALEHGRMRRQSLTYRRNLEELIAERTRKLRVAMTSLERSYDVTLEAMGDALDLRDAETQGHSKRVTAYTVALAREMRLSAAELKVIARGAFLHDIGKIAIPDSILLKPGKLTPDEMAVMREHCQRGYEMVRKIPFLDEAAEIVYAHQEAYNGSGYPRGLRGEEIPLGARIFAIADTLDAMTSDRPYRKGLSFPEATAEIKRCQGTQFDPGIVEVFLSLPVETWSLLRESTSHDSQAATLFRVAA
jgi:putative nucleotidyltransferase with HDIG domain